ncbi:MAG TPA: NAD(FAD)-dependent dehydrogenase [Cyanobacteria bacterium UBA11049]|nr:NAD(FAD)-dependent dehydrogenase [Cyanobacteria bacterium UBA11049]
MSVFSSLAVASVGYLNFNRASQQTPKSITKTIPLVTPAGFPRLSPLPQPQETWECSVIVIGGSLGGVAAASHAMQSGAKTCLIELSPWLGGQISSQGVSAVDESLTMRAKENFSLSWSNFKQLIKQQPVDISARANTFLQVKDINSCWVGTLCFPPKAGAAAAEKLLQSSSKKAPGSRWETAIAFKGAEFDSTGKRITAIYAVRRIPRDRNYVPKGRLSQELTSWYSWNSDRIFEKVPIRLVAPPNGKTIVIDATDTGELVGWAGIPYRLGSESRVTTGEIHASPKDNPECTQAFTFPFVLAIQDDGGSSRKQLSSIQPGISRAEHRREYSLEGFPMFAGRSFFNYRRLISLTRNNPFVATPSVGDMTLVNWNRGNDWSWMNPPLILTEKLLAESGQRQNWMGGISLNALKDAENHALLFSQWLMETQAKKSFPLAHLSGANSPMGTVSGLSMMPYIREGRRILGRIAYGQNQFMMREADLRTDVSGGRNFSKTGVALTHYDIDLHGCRDRNWKPSNEATSAPAREFVIRPTFIPLESLIPQRIDNLLIGGKSIAVTHIVNSVTRIHYSEWGIGAAAGATAGWLQTQPNVAPAEIVPQKLMPQLQQNLKKQELRLSW